MVTPSVFKSEMCVIFAKDKAIKTQLYTLAKVLYHTSFLFSTVFLHFLDYFLPKYIIYLSNLKNFAYFMLTNHLFSCDNIVE